MVAAPDGDRSHHLESSVLVLIGLDYLTVGVLLRPFLTAPLHDQRVGGFDHRRVLAVVVVKVEEQAHGVEAGTFLVVGLDPVPRCDLGVGLFQHGGFRLGVVLPAVEGFEIHG